MLRTNVLKPRTLYRYVCNNPLCLKEWYGRVPFTKCIACKSPNIEKKLEESLPWLEKSKSLVATRKDWKHEIRSLREVCYMGMSPVILEQGKSRIRKKYDLACRVGLYLEPRETRITSGSISRQRRTSQSTFSYSKEEITQLEKLYQGFLTSGLKERSRQLIFPHLTPSQRITLRLLERRFTREEMARCLGITRSAVQKRLAKIEKRLDELSRKNLSVGGYRVFLEKLKVV